MNAELEGRVQQRTAQLEAANQELESFSYSVSHDLRTPLRAIDGFSKMLLEDYADQLAGEGQRYLKLIRQSTTHMAALIDDLLAFSRRGRAPVNKQKMSVGDVVRHAIEDLQPERNGRNVEITVGNLPYCNADPLLIRQVFVNLLSNAIKYTRRRDVARIEVGAKPAGRLRDEGEPAPDDFGDPEMPVYYVRDNGVGFDMRYADKLFGVFQRLHCKEDFEGTDVGLATVQRIVKKHGGRVWAKRAVGEGAVFYLTIP
ncbi:MAG TPA: ATP-binding protein [Bryobacteraceae bacterium]|nr:ATP-binding protein [Bryobacteraceae bacterium]